MADSHDIQTEVRKYLIVFGALLFLTVVTVAISYLHLPVMSAIILALIVASFKASLVAGFFMHLLSEKKLIYGILIFTLFFAVMALTIPYYEKYGGIKGTEHLQNPKGQKIATSAPPGGHDVH